MDSRHQALVAIPGAGRRSPKASWMRWHGRQRRPPSCSPICTALRWRVPLWWYWRRCSPCGGCMPRCSTTPVAESTEYCNW